MSRPLCLLACFAVTVACGTLYTFSAYSPQLSDRLGLSASTISAIGMIGNFSMSFSGPFAGYIVDTVGFKYPILISGITTSAGYWILYTIYIYAYPNVYIMALALLMLGIGATFAFSAAVKCAAVNFPHIRGTATAITMSGYGLSAFAISLIAQLTAKRGMQTSSGGAGHMLIVLATVPSILLVCFGPIVVKNQPSRARMDVNFDADTASGSTATSGLGSAHGRSSSLGGRRSVSVEEYNLDIAPLPDSLVARINHRKQFENELNGLELLKAKSFWLYFFILGILAGMGQAYIYTCGYMAKALVASALEGTQKELTQDLVAPMQAHQVALLSLANCCGRLINGTISDALKNNLGMSRTYSLFVSSAVCLASMYFSQHTTAVDSIWLPTTLAGLFYGTAFGAYPGIISDEFGVKRFSFNWGMVALAPIPFSSVFAVRIGKIYDAMSVAPGKCIGAQCFQGAYQLHVVLAGVTFILVFLAVRIQRQPKKEY